MIVSKNLRISKEIFINSNFPDAFFAEQFQWIPQKTNCYLNLNKNYAIVWNLNFFPPKSSFLWDMPDLHKVWCSNHWLGRLAFGSDFLDARLTDWRILSRYKNANLILWKRLEDDEDVFHSFSPELKYKMHYRKFVI